MRILVVDDDRLNREILSRQLAALDHEVISCVNGREAWEIIGSGDISLVVTDWVMPHMDGIELCRKIRDSDAGRYIYTVILTSREEKKDVILGMDAGADDFLVKPVTRDALRACIRAAEQALAADRPRRPCR